MSSALCSTWLGGPFSFVDLEGFYLLLSTDLNVCVKAFLTLASPTHFHSIIHVSLYDLYILPMSLCVCVCMCACLCTHACVEREREMYLIYEPFLSLVHEHLESIETALYLWSLVHRRTMLPNRIVLINSNDHNETLTCLWGKSILLQNWLMNSSAKWGGLDYRTRSLF